VGGDAIYPETFRLAALQGVEVVGVPTLILEKWETELGFKERAAENRMNVVVASKSDSGIYAITEDFTLWTEWKNRPFDGNINYPVVTMTAWDGLTSTTIHPAASANKMVSHRTDVLSDRPWRLAEPIISG
jgi:deaminated glutathione amidase